MCAVTCGLLVTLLLPLISPSTIPSFPLSSKCVVSHDPYGVAGHLTAPSKVMGTFPLWAALGAMTPGLGRTLTPSPRPSQHHPDAAEIGTSSLGALNSQQSHSKSDPVFGLQTIPAATLGVAQTWPGSLGPQPPRASHMPSSQSPWCPWGCSTPLLQW